MTSLLAMCDDYRETYDFISDKRVLPLFLLGYFDNARRHLCLLYVLFPVLPAKRFSMLTVVDASGCKSLKQMHNTFRFVGNVYTQVAHRRSKKTASWEPKQAA